MKEKPRRDRGRAPVVCSIGSTDPTAGAGLFLDADVYARLDVRAVFVVAGITAQNSTHVSRVEALTPVSIVAQMDAIWEQVRPDAVRIGLIPSRQAAVAVARTLRALARRPQIVFDPVLAATSGRRLIPADDLRGVRALMRVATVITPNVAEAQVLTGIDIRTRADAERAARMLSKRYDCAVLVKGGHLRAGDRVVDVLARRDRVNSFAARRLRGGGDARGTGCMLAAALAAGLARGYTLDRAVRTARRFVSDAITSATPLGAGRKQFGAGVARKAV